MEVNPGYKQTEVGVIPEDWDAGNLGRFWGVTDCKHVTAQFVPQGFPLASIREVQSRFVDLTNAKQTTSYFYNQLIEGGRKPCPGDLILSRNATVGEVAQVAELHPPFAMGQDVCLLRKKSSDHSTEFLQAIFKSPVILKQLADLMVGSTFKRANVQQIRNFAVPMPPSAEQRAIAMALTDVDGLLDGLDRLISKKRDLKQATLQQLLTGQTRLPGFQGEWSNNPLRSFVRQFIVPMRDKPPRLKGDIPWCRIEDFDGMYLADSKSDQGVDAETIRAMNLKVYPVGTLLVSCSADLGRCAVVARPLVSNQTFIGLEMDDAAASNLFFYYLMSSKAKELNHLSSGTTISYLPREKFEKFNVLAPLDKQEQTAIAEVLTEIDAELSALDQRREKTYALKQAMMQELLTGRTRLI